VLVAEEDAGGGVFSDTMVLFIAVLAALGCDEKSSEIKASNSSFANTGEDKRQATKPADLAIAARLELFLRFKLVVVEDVVVLVVECGATHAWLEVI
jgi:hypothetical protein